MSLDSSPESLVSNLFPRYSSASSSSALCPSRTDTSSPRTWMRPPSSLCWMLAFKLSPLPARSSFVKSTTSFRFSSDINPPSVFEILGIRHFLSQTRASPPTLAALRLRKIRGLASALKLGSQMRRLLVYHELNQNSDDVAHHPIEHKPARRRKKEEPRQHDRHQPGHHHALHLHRWIGAWRLRRQLSRSNHRDAHHDRQNVQPVGL